MCEASTAPSKARAMRRNCAGVIGAVSHKWQCRRSVSYATSATPLAHSHKIVRESPYFTSALLSQDQCAEDDATMDDTVEKVAERLGRLEDKVERLDQRVEQLDAKVERLDDKVGR